MKRRTFGIFAVSILIAGAFEQQLKAQTPKTTILVSAAASLKDSLESIKTAFQKSHPSIVVDYNFASSGALAQQIEQGAPVDLFISASTKQINNLAQKGLIEKVSPKNILTNSLVLIIPASSVSSKINSFRSLADGNVQKIAIGEPNTVPAGHYGIEVFDQLGISNQVKAKLIYTNSVRSVLSAVEMNNVDAGIVYATDAKISNKVKVVAIAQNNLHSPIVHPLAIIQASKNIPATKTFAQYLLSKPSRTILTKYGFGLLP